MVDLAEREVESMKRPLPLIIPFIVFIVSLSCPVFAFSERYPVGHLDQGLPQPDYVLNPYHEDPDHVLNRIFRASFLVTTTPAEVGLALPREHRNPADFFKKGWYFSVRPGTPADQKLFGGDTRLLSREGFSPEEARAFAKALEEVDGDVVKFLKNRSELAVMFQHDLMRLAERLIDAGKNMELLKPIATVFRKVALPSDQLAKLTPTYELGLRFKSIDESLPQDLLRTQPPISNPYVELLRSSTSLFDASHTLSWSRVFIAWPTGSKGLNQFLSDQAKGHKVEVPIGTKSVLVQGIVAFDDRGRPFATPLAFDVRIKWLENRDPLSFENRTTTRDGIQIRAYELRRTFLRGGDDARLFRPIHDDDQALFRDYGALKHTTQAAQCAVCHRLHEVSDAHLGGFITLSPSAKPRPATTGLERLRLAERETSTFLKRLEKKMENYLRRAG